MDPEERRMNRIGILQGRLLPPIHGKLQAFPIRRWEEEFPLAAQVPLDCIEWIYDLASEKTHPLGNPSGIRRLKQLSRRHGVRIRSLCADCFVQRPLHKGTASIRRRRLEKFCWLLKACAEAGIQRLVLPFVEGSAIRSSEEMPLAVQALREILPKAEKTEVQIHLETSLPPNLFRNLLEKLKHPLLLVNYDIGNSAHLGYDPREEFASYGDRIGSIHVKDRLLRGPSVPLGEGNANIPLVFQLLKAREYQGDLILQAARGPSGEELAWARQNRDFILNRWN